MLALVHELFEIVDAADLPPGDEIIAARMLVELLGASQNVRRPISAHDEPR